MSDELIQQRRWMILGVIGIVVALRWLPGRPTPSRHAAHSEPVVQEQHEAPVLIEA